MIFMANKRKKRHCQLLFFDNKFIIIVYLHLQCVAKSRLVQCRIHKPYHYQFSFINYYFFPLYDCGKNITRMTRNSVFVAWWKITPRNSWIFFWDLMQGFPCLFCHWTKHTSLLYISHLIFNEYFSFRAKMERQPFTMLLCMDVAQEPKLFCKMVFVLNKPLYLFI